MNPSRFLIILVVLGAGFVFGASSSTSKVSVNASPAPTPTPWPDLSTLNNFKNPSGNKCGINGAGVSAEKKSLNRLKNRFRLPEGAFETITFTDLLALDQGEVDTQLNDIVNFPGSGDPNNQRAVTVEGFVASVFTGGCAKHGNKGGESCNCNTTAKALCDAHINVVPQQGMSSVGGRNTYVVEVTERVRRLAAQGLLSSNIGKDWSVFRLQQKLSGHRVRFSGFLFFDTDHANQAWVNDPTNKVGSSNFRQTAWEIHPVMAIRVLD
ncbi:MAG: hypothetical protein ABI596_03265 [Pyrinomonadaceae bacterium]